jgi:hypothetical protein
MKIRMSSVDVAAEVACLKKKLLGMRMDEDHCIPTDPHQRLGLARQIEPQHVTHRLVEHDGAATQDQMPKQCPLT